MRSKLLNADLPITYAVVLDTGDDRQVEVLSLLGDVAVGDQAHLHLQCGSRAKPTVVSSSVT